MVCFLAGRGLHQLDAVEVASGVAVGAEVATAVGVRVATERVRSNVKRIV